MFRHLVVTGRSRLALYLARIPAGLAIIVPLVAAGFTIVCAVCVFAAPTQLNYQGVNVPAGLSLPGSRRGPPTTPTRSSATSTQHRTVSRSSGVLNSGPWRTARRGPGVVKQPPAPGHPPASHAQIRQRGPQIAA